MQTAQVASQQGKYLGQLFGKLHANQKALKANDIPDLDDEVYSDAFNYKHLGNLAYIGNSYVSGHPLQIPDRTRARLDMGAYLGGRLIYQSGVRL